MIDRSMYKKELMRLRHDVDNPNKDGRRKGLPYAKVWPAGTVFQVEDRRADLIQRDQWKCEALGVEFDPVAARRKAFESEPRGALRLKIGDRFWEVGHYDLEFDDDFDRHLEKHPLSKIDKIDHKRICAWNDIYRALERRDDNLGTLLAACSAESSDLLMHLIDMGRVSLDDVREAQSRWEEQDEGTYFEQCRRHGT